MSFINKIKQDMYNAMKEGNKHATSTLRVLLSELKEKSIEKKDDLTDEESIKIIKTLVKQRKESAEVYTKAGRKDLAKKEKNESEILKIYLPEILSEKESRELVINTIEEISANDISQMGQVMSMVMKKGKGKIDGTLANKIVRELLK